jgi:hypothetical protein
MADTYTKLFGVGGKTCTVSTQKILAAAGDYGAEDVLSESATNGVGTDWDFVDIAKSIGGNGYITKALVLCSTTALTPRITLYLFAAPPTSELDDNAANTAVATADLANYIGRIDFNAMEDLGGMSGSIATVSTLGNLPLAYNCDESSDTLYGIAVTRDAITGEAASMTLTISLTSEPA